MKKFTDTLTVQEYREFQIDNQEYLETLEDKARRIVANESPSSDDEHYEMLVQRLLNYAYKTGETLERAWILMP